nr:MAG TPA_asm: hypothetical protein [Caudoviricetes sp.]
MLYCQHLFSLLCLFNYTMQIYGIYLHLQNKYAIIVYIFAYLTIIHNVNWKQLTFFQSILFGS